MRRSSAPYGCPLCQGDENLISFDYESAAAGRPTLPGQPPPVVSAIRPVRAAKGGALLRCEKCRREFYRTGYVATPAFRHWNTMVIPERGHQVFEEWLAGTVRPSSAVWSALRTIGATPLPLDDMGLDRFVVPCAVTLNTGERLDPTFFHFRRSPPVWAFSGRFWWATQVRAVTPSSYALPFDVRAAVSLAEEVTNGFYPTCVVTPDGRDFTLHGLSAFLLDVPGVDPASFHVVRDLSVFAPGGRPHGPLVQMSGDRISHVIADWTPEDEALKLPVP